MNSTWMLFKTQRRSLPVCAALCFLVMFLLVYAYFKPSTLDRAHVIPSLSFGIAFMATCLARYHTALFNMPFPVTHRQLAWIPTLCLALLWAAGLAGALSGIGVLSYVGGPGYTLSRWTPIILAVLKTLPLAFLVFAIGDRILRYLGIGAIGFVFIAQIYFIGKQFGGLESALAFYEYAWPLCIVIGVFFILEAPIHVATMDYPARMKQEWTNMNVRLPDAPMRTPAMKIVADFCMALMLLLVAVWFISILFSMLRPSNASPLRMLYIGFLPLLALFGIRSAWRSTWANGFSTEKTFVVFLMKCSLVLLPLAWALGAKRGIVASCDHCRQHKFVWAHHCPYCGHANQGTVLRALPIPLRKTSTNQPPIQKRMSSRRLYRVALPFYLVMFGLITGSSSWFKTESITLWLTDDGSEQAEGALDDIKEYLVSIDDARDWLDGGGDAPPVLPQRFRLEMVDDPAILNLKFYWLRWEEAGALRERVTARILLDFPDASLNASTESTKSGYRRKRVNRAALPSFLDQDIHLVDRKNW